MAISSDRAFKVLMQILADTSGLKQLDADLDKTKEKLDEVGDAGKGAADKADELKNRLTVAFGIGAIAAAPFVIMLQQSGELVQQLSEDILAQTRALDKQVDSWIKLARAANDLGDAVKLADRVATDIASLIAQYDTFRSGELNKWQVWADRIAKFMNPLGFAGGGAGPNQQARDDAEEKFRQNIVQGVTDANVILDTANDAIARVAEIKAKPVAEGIFLVTQRVDELKSKLADLDAQRKLDPAATVDQAKAVNEVLKKYGQVGEQLKNEEGLLKELTAEQNRQTPVVEKTRAAHEKIVDELEAEKLALQEINAEMATIEGNPFLTLDQQSSALASLIPKAIELESAIQGSGAAIDQLNIKMRLTTFGGQFQASMVQWVNQFGTTATQIGNIITSTIGTAVNGVSQAITGAIFRTQSWGQAFAQVAQQIVGNIIQIVLQWAVSRAIMAFLNIAFGKAEAKGISAAAQEATAAWAPAAISASIASYGAAAGAGNIAYIAALLSGTAFASGLSAAGGSFEIGGFTGTGGSQDIAGIVHRGEYVMPKSAVDRAGVGAMDSFRASAEGGRGGGVAIFNFTDMKALEKAYLQSTAAKKMIIHTVNGAGGNLRT